MVLLLRSSTLTTAYGLSGTDQPLLSSYAMASTNKDVLLRGEIKDIPGTTGTENALFVFDSGWKWTSHIALSLAENLHTKLVHSDGTPHLPGTDCSTRAPACLYCSRDSVLLSGPVQNAITSGAQ